ncbi:MAG: DUF3426 domain-containing protein [Gammaproteobacteria bacterium]|nr:DUF3426 domain-containing protein [Gammaproteobacteria bacterium]
MYTHCPECSTYFRITAEQLRAAQGKVRCSNCETVFSALETLEETLPAGQVSANEDQNTTPAKETAKKEKKSKKSKKDKRVKTAGHGKGFIKALFSILLTLILITGFLAQFAYFQRNDLVAKYPVLLPYFEQACGLAHMECDFSLRKDYSKLSLEHKDIRVHPKVKKSLLINGNLMNQANFVQPYPIVTLTFTDSQDKVVARRGFTPTEYLSNPAQAEAGLSPRESALLVLEVLDPGPDATNFTFDFH